MVVKVLTGVRRPSRIRPTSEALTTSGGCWLAKPENSRTYCTVKPPVNNVLNPRGLTKTQSVHRLAIRAWGSHEQNVAMLVLLWEASHLCHQRRCCNPQHLVIETHRSNERRKPCWVKKVCVCQQHPRCVL